MMHSDARPIRIGRIDYTNVWPVFHHFDPSRLRCEAELVYGMPAELNRMLRAGEIDVAAVSSFAYGIHSEDYLLLPDLSVSAPGQVQSLLLFLKSPLEQVRRGKIALTATSATTVNLLKIVMKKFYGGDPVYETMEPDLDRMLENADAALLIGDHAIRASWRETGYRALDLGDLWRLWTGRWMTFAVWAVRRDAALRHPEAIAEIYAALVAAKRRSAADSEPLAQEAVRRIGGTADYWRGYFRGLCHDFGPEQRAGLSLYFQYARELGLMEKPVTLADWPDSVHA
ncbi:menaquinone biosynthesis protein [Cohnella thermotolerans]|uniref:menaquinone biosynthesis protein n=1 Tax=Cohnella thermotolerans TaxID=329858 RepID=UPI000406F445